jgi:hypothetical protein
VAHQPVPLMEALKQAPSKKGGSKLIHMTPPLLLANSKNAIQIANQRQAEQQAAMVNLNTTIFSDQSLSQKLIKDFKQQLQNQPAQQKILPFEAYLK